MHAAKVVEREPAGNSGPMVLPLFAEGVRKTGESPIAHSIRQLWQVIEKLSLSSTAVRRIIGLGVRCGESRVGFSPDQDWRFGRGP
jgi:hypothetical protein